MQTTKTALLALLKSGDFVSGEALAEEIGVSRQQSGKIYRS